MWLKSFEICTAEIADIIGVADFLDFSSTCSVCQRLVLGGSAKLLIQPHHQTPRRFQESARHRFDKHFHWGCKTRAIWISKTQPLAATCSHSSGRKWPQVAAGGCRSKWPQVAASGRRGPQGTVGASGRKWPQVATEGCRSKRPQGPGGCRSKWPQVPQVAAFGQINFYLQSNISVLSIFSHPGC